LETMILMMDTGRTASVSAARWLAQNGCRVVLVQKELRPVSGIDTVQLDLLDQEAVEAFVETFPRLDLLVLGVPPCPDDGPIGTGHRLDEMLDALVYLGRGAANLTEACIPRLRMGMKRIACITEPEGTHSLGCEAGNLLRHQMHAALHMYGRECFNRLRPEGFTFRWFCEGDLPGPMCAGEYLLAQLSYHPDEAAMHSDENRLIIRDGFLREIPW